MENKNIKKSKDRPKYQPNIEELKELFRQIADKKITNEERMANSKMRKNKMV